MNKITKFYSSDIVQAVAALFSSNLLAAVVGVIVSIIQGRFISADDLGYFGQFGIASSYLFLLHFGVFHAVERLAPYYYGNSEPEKAQRVVQAGEAWMIVVCLPVMAGFACLSLAGFLKGNWKAGLGWLAQVFVTITQLYSGFIKATYRSGQDFKRLAQGQMITPIMYLLCLPVYWIQPYTALFIRTASTIVSDFAIYRTRPFQFKPRFDKEIFLQMIRQGFPLFFSSYILTTGLSAIQSTLVLRLLGYEALGYWTFSNTIITYARYLPNAIAAVYIPKIIQKYGETHRLTSCLCEAVKPLKASFCATLLVIAAGEIGAWKILPVILPNYKEASKLIAVMLITMPLYLVSIGEVILTAANKIKMKAVCAVLNVILQIGSTLILYAGGYGIYSFAGGTFVGYMAELIIVSAYLLKRSSDLE